MAIRSKDEIIEQVKLRIGEDSDDETLSFLEDVTDTITDLETRASGDGTDWKSKYEENDEMWRKKYRDRFFSPEVQDNEGDEVIDKDLEEDKPMRFEDLFKEE